MYDLFSSRLANKVNTCDSEMGDITKEENVEWVMYCVGLTGGSAFNFLAKLGPMLTKQRI